MCLRQNSLALKLLVTKEHFVNWRISACVIRQLYVSFLDNLFCPVILPINPLSVISNQQFINEYDKTQLEK